MFVNRKALPLLAAVLASVAGTGAALGDISTVVFHIEAETDDGRRGSFSVPLDLSPGAGYWDPVTQEYNWSLPGVVQILDQFGSPIATLGTASVYCREDPQVDLNFSVFAGALNTTFTITSPTLSFGTINDSSGRTSAGFTVSDQDGNGVGISGWNGNSIYTSRYNGAVPGGTTFHDSFFGSFGTPIPDDTFATSENFPGVGFTPIGTPVSDMSSRFRFTLTANDLASGTSQYEIIPIPAPGAATLLGLGGLLVGRRRR